VALKAKEKKMRNPIITAEWVSWLAASAAGSMALTAFAFGSFETKIQAKETKEDMKAWMIRIEQKLDALSEKLARE
jgi:hypothetical protein